MSSEIRNPVEKKSSRIARSRNPWIVLVSGALNRRASSCGVIKSSERSGTFANSMRSGESDSTSRLRIYFKNARSAMR